MGIQYLTTPTLITERQWRITGIETPAMFVHKGDFGAGTLRADHLSFLDTFG